MNGSDSAGQPGLGIDARRRGGGGSCRPMSTRSSPRRDRRSTPSASGRWPRRRANGTCTRRSRDDAYKRLTRRSTSPERHRRTRVQSTTYDIEAGLGLHVRRGPHGGQDDWTTLPDANGNTSQATRRIAATDGWARRRLHPFLAHYQDDGRTRTVRARPARRRVERRDRRLPRGQAWRSTSPPSRASRSRFRSPTRPTRSCRGSGCSSTTPRCWWTACEHGEVVRDRPRRLDRRWAAGGKRAEPEQLDPDRRPCSRRPRASRRRTRSTRVRPRGRPRRGDTQRDHEVRS